tara:strand:+ start:500 stop:1417 length:918 start_codon:yes stop_codon:yes gene_type:complete
MDEKVQESVSNPDQISQDQAIDPAEKAVFGSSEASFFDALENEVNGAIQDEPTEATQQQVGDPEQATRIEQNVGSNSVDWDDDGNPYKKRYADSSREAVKLAEQYKSVERFVPVLEAMKNDSGLVEHVRDYLVNGGAPSKSIQSSLGLDEDFIYNEQEAMSDPNSDSAKVMNAHVDKIVQQRVGSMLQHEKQNASKQAAENRRLQEEAKFRKETGMSDEEYGELVNWAKGHTLTLDDINYLKNKQKVAGNVAQATKQDMLNQMKNVQGMPSTVSGANSSGQEKSADNSVFDALLGTDNELDNLFG